MKRLVPALALVAAAIGPFASAGQDATPPQPVVLTGRFLFPDGSPAPGVELRVLGWESNSERVAEHGLPRDWRDPSTVTAHDGIFRMSFVAPAAYQFTLDGYLPGHAPDSWRWSRLEAGTTRDLGDVLLRPGGAIEVRIVRPDGSPAPYTWRVHGDNGDGAEWDGRDSTRRTGEYLPSRGVWRIEDLPAGVAVVKAYSQMANWIEGDPVRVRAGETVECELVFDGPDPASRIVVTTFARPIRVNPDSANVWLELVGSDERIPCSAEFGSQSYDFPGLAFGEYKVVVDDPAFERWERSGVFPGTRVDAHLTGSASIRLEVLDREDGHRITDWSLAIRKEPKRIGTTTFSGGTTPLVLKGQRPPEDGRIGSIVPWDYTLLLEAPAYPFESIPVPDLKSGEERVIRVELSRSGAVAGIVLCGAEAARGVDVELYHEGARAGDIGSWDAWSHGNLAPFRIGTAVTDAEGCFRIPCSTAGPLIVRAVAGPGLHALQEVSHGGSGTTETRVTIPAPVYLVGSVLAPAGAVFDGFLVRAAAADAVSRNPVSNWVAGFDEFLESGVAADGSFRLGPLPPGALRFGLLRGKDPRTGKVPAPAGLLERRLEVDVPGDLPIEVDLRDIWPGTLEIELRSSATPLEGLRVVLKQDDGERLWTQTIADDDGVARFEPLADTYRVEVTDAAMLWCFEAPDPVVVERGRSHALSLEVPAFRAELTVLAAETQLPAPGVRVLVARPDGRSLRRSFVTTDAEGRIALTLTPGPVWLERIGKGIPGQQSVEGMTRVEWTSTGPESGEVELEGPGDGE